MNCCWMNGWIDGWIDGWLDEWTDGWIDGRTSRRMGSQADGRTGKYIYMKVDRYTKAHDIRKRPVSGEREKERGTETETDRKRHTYMLALHIHTLRCRTSLRIALHYIVLASHHIALSTFRLN